MSKKKIALIEKFWNLPTDSPLFCRNFHHIEPTARKAATDTRLRPHIALSRPGRKILESSFQKFKFQVKFQKIYKLLVISSNSPYKTMESGYKLGFKNLEGQVAFRNVDFYLTLLNLRFSMSDFTLAIRPNSIEISSRINFKFPFRAKSDR